MAAKKAVSDWLLCADWLVRCGILPDEHPAAKETAHLPDLANVLRDGVLLCELLLRFKPGCIAPNEYCQNTPTTLFLCRRNILVFLRVCKTTFQLKDADLFEFIDVQEISSFWKVIRTLSKLSQCRAVQALKIVPFKVDDKRSSYLNMEEFPPDDFAEDNVYAKPSYQKGDEDIYGRLMDYVSPATLTKDFPAKEAPQPTSHRDLCIKELIESEGKYLEVLRMIKDKFMGQLRPVIAPQDHAVIFKNIEQLNVTHTQFYQDLRKVFAKESSYTIADCFIMFKEKFTVYGDYCSNLLTAQELLIKICQTNSAVQQTVHDCQVAANDSQFKLWELLTVPMQRVLKYHLFLKELIKNTDADLELERKSLQRALTEIEDLSLFVNEVTRDNEMIRTIDQVEHSINDLQLGDGVHLKDYGRMLMDGEIKVKSDSSAKNPQRYVFLFDKVLLICKPAGEMYKFKSFVPLSNFDLDDALSVGKSNAVFTLRERSGRMTFVFTAKNAETRYKWTDAICMAKDNVSPRYSHDTGHNFVMSSYSTTTICDVCRKLLRGVFFQGYKCRITNLNVHKECLEKAKDMAGPPTLTVRRSSEASLRSTSSDIAMSPSPSSKQDTLIRPNAVGAKRPARAETIIGDQPLTPRRPVTQMTRSQSMSKTTDDVDHIYNNENDNYVNALYSRPWYAGDMSRAEAEEKLRSKPNGTFLVRISTTKQEPILSIKHGTVLHTVINRTSNGRYYFKKIEVFNTIAELVEHYRTHSLEQMFKEVDTCLVAAYNDAPTIAETKREPGVLGYCCVLYNYAARSPNQLTLKENDRIAIISKAGEARGWWKGKLGSQVGYFPYAYVTEEG